MSENNPAADDVVIENHGGSQIERNIKSKATWMRALFMCIFVALLWLASLVGVFVVVLGFFWVLFTGEVNKQLRQAGQGIAGYIHDGIRYLTFNTDTKPFPFGDPWPSGTPEDTD